MKLGELIPGAAFPAEVSGISYDSRKVRRGDLFFAVPGFKTKGSLYVPDALAAGAVAAAVEDLEDIAPELREKCVTVRDARRALAEASARFHGHPSRDLLTIGVTGTKGKTSTTFLVESILREAGHKVALLGTVLCRHPGREAAAERTTMESPELQKFLHEARGAGATAAVLEVSSHALTLHRVGGCEFDGVVFTNLSEDHLDFHGTMENYFRAKALLFTDYAREKRGRLTVGAANLDDSWGARLPGLAKTGMVGFSRRAGSPVDGSSLQAGPGGITGKIRLPGGSTVEVESALVGNFNISNILAAVAVCHGLGVDPEAIARGIRALTGVSGRLERVPTTLPFQVFVDFAHMGHALENVLRSLRPVCRGRLVAVFGAGGDRDPARRGQLGRVAARLADHTVITSDNPRSEPPEKIMDAVETAWKAELAGLPELALRRSYERVQDRRKAIERALTEAGPGDVICLAGKGHETGQIVAGKTHPFDDREEAAKVLRRLEGSVDSPKKT
ncbi:MAG: UDP-N-acetylmuramoyl-L-alanyl-D-glutamate--2,6-diaminopimelate ligase [Bdellovibrionales bacterium]|nr:UDP-N-acetylmuramoyl-L-alanyl-D-glutamate--2,6-diaminopimelate ligase [Bdellovibrionales bacterium]